MSITLNHTIVPARDKDAAARFFAQIFGLKYEGPMGHFAPVRVNEDLTLDFDNAESLNTTTTLFTLARVSSIASSGACRMPGFRMEASREAWTTGS